MFSEEIENAQVNNIVSKSISDIINDIEYCDENNRYPNWNSNSNSNSNSNDSSSDEINEFSNMLDNITRYSENIVPTVLKISCILFGIVTFFSFMFILFASLMYAF